jgi:hypothetical protein
MGLTEQLEQLELPEQLARLVQPELLVQPEFQELQEQPVILGSDSLGWADGPVGQPPLFLMDTTTL